MAIHQWHKRYFATFCFLLFLLSSCVPRIESICRDIHGSNNSRYRQCVKSKEQKSGGIYIKKVERNKELGDRCDNSIQCKAGSCEQGRCRP